MEHYSLALSLDPKNEGALSGLHRMEAGSEGGLEASYDMEMAEIGKHSDLLFHIELLNGDFGIFSCMYYIHHCFICRPSDTTVSVDAGIEPRTFATSALAVRRSSHLATSHPRHLFISLKLEATVHLWSVSSSRKLGSKIKSTTCLSYVLCPVLRIRDILVRTGSAGPYL